MTALPVIKSPREIRLLSALQISQKSREELDRIVGASNTPDLVLRLRRKGFAIPCEKVPGIDRDGLPCHYGRYSLTEKDVTLVAEVLAAECRP